MQSSEAIVKSALWQHTQPLSVPEELLSLQQQSSCPVNHPPCCCKQGRLLRDGRKQTFSAQTGHRGCLFPKFTSHCGDNANQIQFLEENKNLQMMALATKVVSSPTYHPTRSYNQHSELGCWWFPLLILINCSGTNIYT